MIGECITKLGKSTASQISVDKVSDSSGGEKTVTDILSKCITKLGNSMAGKSV